MRAVVTLALVGTVLAISATTTSAATIATLTVDTLDYVGDDTDPGDGVCETSEGTCTLRAAIQEANALDAGPGDEVLINFAPELDGFIIGPDSHNATNRMLTGTIEPGWDGHGAFYHVMGRLRIDFDDRVGFSQQNDGGAGFYIDAPDVTLENFTRHTDDIRDHGGSRNRGVTGIVAGETAIIVSGNGNGLLLENGALAEHRDNRFERGIILQDGADDVTVRNVLFDNYRRLGGAIRVSNNATITNFTLDSIVMDNTDDGNYAALEIPNSVTFNNLQIVNSEFNDWQWRRPFEMRGVTFNGGAFSNNLVDTATIGAGTYFMNFREADMTDFTFSDNVFERVGARRLIDLRNSTLDNVTISGNTFQNMRNVDGVNATVRRVVHARDAISTELSIVNNTFDNVESTSYDLILLARGEHDDLVISGNTFTDVDVSGSVVNLDRSPTSNVTISHNTFSETSSGGAAIYANRVSSSSSVHNNSWINADDSKEHRKIFLFALGSVGSDDTGWAFQDNHIQTAHIGNRAPVQVNSGFLPVERNTFSAPARGTTPAEDDAALSETDAGWFVSNQGNNANGKLRTWYPNAVEIDDGTQRARVTVQPPEEGETPHPATPVAVDVYYTPGANGERQADVYLGRVAGLTDESTFEVNCSGCSAGGYIRVQTIAPNGATTQYSRIHQADAGSVDPADLAIDLDDDDEVAVGSTISGSGTAGNTVEVVNTDNDEVLCTAEVAESGNWSCAVDFETTPGPGTIVATDTDTEVETDPVSVDIVAPPVILGVGDGDDVAVGSTITGSGTPGTTIEVTNEDTDEVLCTTTVTSDGTWSCSVDFGTTQGPATIAANEIDGASSDPVDVDVVPAPVILAVGDDEEVALGETIGGSGNPGTTIEVVNEETDEVLCTTTVTSDGTWSCEVDENTTLGEATLVANELDSEGDIEASSPPVPVEITMELGEVNDLEVNFAPDEPATVDPLDNATPPMGAAFDPTTVVLLDDAGDPQTTLVVDGEGTYEVDTDTGEITFTPEPGFDGATTPVAYQVMDTAGNEYEAQVTFSEAPFVDIPIFGPGALVVLAIVLSGLAVVIGRRRWTAMSH